MPSITLNFDSARQAQQLFDNDPHNLELLKNQLSVKATSRDGWIKLDGEEGALKSAKDVFDALRAQLDSGHRPRQREFLKAIETVKENGADALKSINTKRITTSPPQATGDPEDYRSKNLP